jgi:hypothetical protein
MAAEESINAQGSYLKVEVLKEFVKDKNESSLLQGQRPQFALVKVIQASKDTEELKDKNVVVQRGSLISKNDQFFVFEDHVLYADND